VVDTDPIETQEAEPFVTVAVMFGVVSKGFVKVTARINVDTLVVPDPY
jgi:hypothetical protein